MITKAKPNGKMMRKVAQRHGVDEVVLGIIWPPEAETTTVDEVEAGIVAAGVETDRRALVHFLKDLQELGYGRFMTGRKGHKSRFEWAISILQHAEAPEDASEGAGDSVAPEIISHSFMLRKDFKVDIALPADMSSAEARRLSAFVSSLPFDDEHGS